MPTSTARIPDLDFPTITAVDIDDIYLSATFSDGRRVSIPIIWSSRLESATPEQRKNFEITPAGYGIHWPDIDEDISVRAFLDPKVEWF